MLRLVALVTLITVFLGSCSPAVPTPTHPPLTQTTIVIENAEPTTSPPDSVAQLPVPEPGINPLTGLPVTDPSLLQVPAVLLSVSHFPVEARPQAGLSFAPYVFEFYITEGATRFLATFYGEFPAPESPVTGDCAVRREIFMQTGNIVGNRVWDDENQNGIQEFWEKGIGGVCVNLYDTAGTLLQQTTTDSNGYYGFNVHPGQYILEFLKPAGMEFVPRDSGDEERDSDVDPGTGRTEILDVPSAVLHLDAGLIHLNLPADTSALPPALVGPVRSGRLIYADIAAFFPDSCLIYAFASAEILVELPYCAFVEHNIEGGGYMLEIPELIQLANDSKKPDQVIDYTSNAFSADPPEGGVPASRLHVYFAWLNQSTWKYDPLSESWWRYVDDADEATAGYVHPEIDRLTGRQLHFENVIVLFARHDVISPTNLDIHLEQDWLGDALLFREGKMYNIRWSTVPTEEEFQTGRRKPIRFLSQDDTTPFPLKPGHTWIVVVTPETTVTEQAPGEWLLQFFQPPGAK